MGYQAWFKLRRNPCPECEGARYTVLYPWIELMLLVPIEAEIGGFRGRYYVTNEPFDTPDCFNHSCPYCTLEDDFPFDSFDDGA